MLYNIILETMLISQIMPFKPGVAGSSPASATYMAE